MTWSSVWEMEPSRLSFLLKAVHDVLPSPVNLVTWGLTDDPKCTLCGELATLSHILTACKVALSQGRYSWRHDQVLRVLAKHIKQARVEAGQTSQQPAAVQFVRAGETVQASAGTKSNRGILRGGG